MSPWDISGKIYGALPELRDIVDCKLWVDEYCYWEGRAHARPVLDNYAMEFTGVGPFELKYLDYWQWFWEGKE